MIEPAANDDPRVLELMSEYGAEIVSRAAWMAEEVAAWTHTREEFVLALCADGSVAGCLALRRLDDVTGEVRRMFVRPSARRQGVARRLLEAIEEEARRLGMTRLVLDTMEELVEARALYPTAGYTPIEAYSREAGAAYWFEKLL